MTAHEADTKARAAQLASHVEHSWEFGDMYKGEQTWYVPTNTRKSARMIKRVRGDDSPAAQTID